MRNEIERCRLEQAHCRDHILSGKPDANGAWLGLQDWFKEELMIEQEFDRLHWERHQPSHLPLNAMAMWVLMDVNEEIAAVQQRDGFWECVYRGESVAFRPDLDSAKHCIITIHDIRTAQTRRAVMAQAGADIRQVIRDSVVKYNLQYRELVAILAQEILGWQKD